jgi:hypothetical protein
MMDLLLPLGFWLIAAGLLTAFIGGLPLGARWRSPILPKRLQLIGAGIFLEGVALASFPAVGTGARVALSALALAVPLALWGLLGRPATDAPTAPLGIGPKLAYAFGGIAACVGIFLVATPGCACLSPEELARAKLRSALGDVIRAERARFDSIGRFTGALDSLGGSLGYDARLTLTRLSDSAYVLGGKDAGLTCRFEGRPSQPIDAHATCQED